MLRLAFKCSVVALALLASAPSSAQQGGLSGKLADASKQLQSDVQTCKPINLGEYQALLNEAAKNKQRAEKAAKKNVPVDVKQVDADLAAASALFNQATAALVQQCMRAAQQQAQPSPQAAMNLSPFASRILNIHNAERVSLGAQALRWNPALEASAAAWAQQLARTGELVHAPREGRGIERENLQKGLIGWSPDEMMNQWLNERRDFVAGVYPNVARDGNWANVSHYSQMIWPTTTDIGCGSAIGGGFNWMVCRYSPGGNKDGKPVGYDEAMDSATSAIARGNGPKFRVMPGDLQYLKVRVPAECYEKLGQGLAAKDARECPAGAGSGQATDTSVKNPGLPGNEVFAPANRPPAGGTPILADEKFRKAMLESINRQSIVDNIAASEPAVWTFYGEAGARYDLGGSWLTPFAAVDYTDVRLPSFTETGVPGVDFQTPAPLTFELSIGANALFQDIGVVNFASTLGGGGPGYAITWDVNWTSQSGDADGLSVETPQADSAGDPKTESPGYEADELDTKLEPPNLSGRPEVFSTTPESRPASLDKVYRNAPNVQSVDLPKSEQAAKLRLDNYDPERLKIYAIVVNRNPSSGPLLYDIGYYDDPAFDDPFDPIGLIDLQLGDDPVLKYVSQPVPEFILPAVDWMWQSGDADGLSGETPQAGDSAGDSPLARKDEVDTKVEQPVLPLTEVFTPKAGAPKGVGCVTAECGSGDVVTQFVTECNITVAALCAGNGSMVGLYEGLDLDVPLFGDLVLSEADIEQPQLPLPEVFQPPLPDKLEDPM